MFTNFMSAQYQQLIEEKLKKSIGEKKVAEYREMLVTRGADLSYTLEARGMETPQGSVEGIIDAAIEALQAEVDGIVQTIVGGSTNEPSRFSRRGKIKVTKASALRGKNGRFIGALKLATLLNSMVKIKAADIMKNNKYGNTLNFRTGRLANSVSITSLNVKTSSIFFTYMYYPYQTFEPGFKQHKPGRDPRDIFTNAIAESLAELISQKDLANTKFSVYSGRSKHGTV